MDEETLRRKLQNYQDICMESTEIKTMLMEEHSYSKGFHRKMKSLLWSRRNFGRDIRMGYAVRRIAIVVILVLSLLVVNQVSAHVWGIGPWEFLRSLVDGGKGIRVEIHKSRDSSDKVPEAKYEIPQYVPKDYKLTLYDDAGGVFLDAEWRGKGDKQLILYGRTKLIDGGVDIYDAEVDNRKKMQVAGITVEIYYDRDEMGLHWYDERYSYLIQSYIMDEGELIKMMESIYQ